MASIRSKVSQILDIVLLRENDIKTAEVSTMSRDVIGAATNTLTTALTYGARAVCKKSGTYTQLRFCTGSTAPGGTYTDCRVAVFNSDGTQKLAESANVVATVTAASTIYTISLGAGCTLNKGDVVYLAIGFIATTMPTLRGLATIISALSSLVPVLGRQSAAGWTTGNAMNATLPTAGSSVVPWMELLP